MKNILDHISRVTGAASAGEYFVRIMQLIGVLGIGGVSVYLAAATEWLRQYAPVSWLIIGLGGTLIGSIIIFVISKSMESASRRDLYKSYSHVKTTSNPLDQHFINKTIHVSDFYSPIRSIYKEKLFENCDIFGPGILYIFSASTISNCEFRACDFIEVSKPDARTYSALGFESSVFRGCRFFQIAFVINPILRKKIEEMGGGTNWLD